MTGALRNRVVAGVSALLLLGACAGPGTTSTAEVEYGPRTIEPGASEALVGRTTGSLPAVLGAPLLIRREPESAYARFLADACVLDVFLHETDSPRGLLVRYVEVRPATLRDPGACTRLEARLRDVAAQRVSGPA